MPRPCTVPNKKEFRLIKDSGHETLNINSSSKYPFIHKSCCRQNNKPGNPQTCNFCKFPKVVKPWLPLSIFRYQNRTDRQGKIRAHPVFYRVQAMPQETFFKRGKLSPSVKPLNIIT